MLQTEQLFHSDSDYMMQHNWRERCPRQLQCMQSLLRAHASRRVRYDGDAIPFGIYTAAEVRGMLERCSYHASLLISSTPVCSSRWNRSS